ncbi:hypothetical protein [Pseudoruegeria sp. HB172150]|uniref:hypothetical protein n=1 Tax=Pseudoruegeria sp. HB172150 TaxID=2721164 RepID=UPI00155193C7|nr:hypothetical protein [Pseudoruegeria sp. HB172150]
MTFFLRIFTAWLCLAAALPVQAQALTPEESRAHARAAIELFLGRGDRIAGIAEAMRGLPPNPTAEDMERYPEAANALWRAYASKGFKLNARVPAFAQLNRDGSRMLLLYQVNSDMPLDQRPPTYLLDTATGLPVGEPVPASETGEIGFITSVGHTGFSPDGSTAYIAARDGVLFLDARTGARLYRLPSAGISAPQPYGFSHDGRYFVTYERSILEGTAATVYDTATWQQVAQFPLGGKRFTMKLGEGMVEVEGSGDAEVVGLMGWNGHGALLGQTGSTDPSQPASLIEIALDGTRRVIAADVMQEPFSLFASPDRRILALRGSDRMVVMKDDGQVLFESAFHGEDIGAFVRNGTAISIALLNRFSSAPDLELSVVDLTGAALEPQVSDFVPFNNLLYSAQGEMLGFVGSGGYEGLDVPNGPELYRAAFALLSAEQQRELADAGTRPAPPPELVQETPQLLAEAEMALQAGDRIGAIRALLDHFPPDPGPEDLDPGTYAYQLLWRVAASRNSQIEELHMGATNVVDPTGTRRVALYSPDHETIKGALYDANTGELISELVIPDAIASDGGYSIWGTYVSPTGDMLAVGNFGRVHFYDGRTGALLRSVYVPAGEKGSSASYAGFSQDGEKFALRYRNTLHIVSPSTGAIATTAMPDRGFELIGWMPDGGLALFEHPLHWREAGYLARIYSFRDGHFSELFTVREEPEGLATTPGAVEISEQGTAFAFFESSTERFVIYTPDGKRTYSGKSIHGDLHFVRDGQAFAHRVNRPQPGNLLNVVAIDGSELEAIPQDFPLFEQSMFDQSGVLLDGAPTPLSAIRYRGEDVPQGRALFDYVRDELLPMLGGTVENAPVDPMKEAQHLPAD